MDYTFLLLLLLAVACNLKFGQSQHENVPYENVENICKTCICLSAQSKSDKRFHHTISCAAKGFNHILARWPEEFGKNHNDADIVATFSGNSLDLLQQLPATNASLTFSCRNCGIRRLQAPAFLDTPNIRRLDLSCNKLTTDELTPDVFRGPYRATRYEPIALIDLNLSNNQLRALNKKLFEHTPQLTVLNLSYNNLKPLDPATTAAISSAAGLESLDLSATRIEKLPASIFTALTSLKMLNIAHNEFVTLPGSLKLVGRSLDTLNLAGNLFERFDEQSFLGLKALKGLNINDIQTLQTIARGTFTRLETLEFLNCSRNFNLSEFDLDSLTHCANLTLLDISHCSISSLPLAVDLSQTLTTVNGTTTAGSPPPSPWPRLRIFETVGNPWLCDCNLLRTLEYAGAHHRKISASTEARCKTPYIFAGARLSNLTAARVCSMQIPKKYSAVNEDPPRFLRKRYIILTAITVAVVLVIGLLIGFVVVCIRRRLKSDDFGIEPIRYTSVRSSNLSAFSHVQASGNGNHA